MYHHHWTQCSPFPTHLWQPETLPVTLLMFSKISFFNIFMDASCYYWCPPLCRSIMPSALSLSSWWKISGKSLDPPWMCFQNRAYRRILSIRIFVLEKTFPSPIYKRSGKSGERSETGGQRTHKGSFILPTWPSGDLVYQIDLHMFDYQLFR